MAEVQWGQLKEIVGGALELQEGERIAFLDDACGGDEDLRNRARKLVELQGDAGRYFDGPATGGGAGPATEGRTIGHYKVLGTIATGGMGVVYAAEQEHPHRTVALKVLRKGMSSPSLARRFRHEAEILGRVRHPNIAQVYEAGTFDEGDGSRPWFAMELIRGRPITAHAESHRLGTRDRLKLFAKVCDAVQVAHHKGVIHRDLKPDNVLVDEHGEPKILDFGVARLTDSDIQVTTLQTDAGQLVGTVSYMSPEQATGDPHELDTRSDVYALGVLLYELLSGRLPYDLADKNIPQVLRVIGEQEPTHLSSVRRAFRGDLDTIATKALEKDRSRRYQTAAELATDLRHYLRDEPIVARPASTFYQLRKFAKRNKAVVAGVAVAFTALSIGAAAAAWQAVEAHAEAERARVRWQFIADIIAATDFAAAGRRLTISHVLDDAAAKVGVVFASEPEIEAEIRHLIGLSYASMSAQQQSVEQLALAREIRRRQLGENHPDTLDSAHHLGEKLRESWRWAEARDVLAPVVESRRRVLGDEHPDTLRSIHRLADVLVVLGHIDEAEGLAREAVRGLTRTYGPRSEEVLLARKELAEVEGSRWRWDEAVAIARDNLDVARRTLGEDHWVTVDLMWSLAGVAHYQGDKPTAETLMRECADRRQRLFGADDIVALYYRDFLGWFLVRQGQVQEGEGLVREAAESMRRIYGERHVRTFYAMRHLGELAWEKGELDEAERLLRRSLAVQREMLGDGHPHVPQSMARFGSLLCERGRHEEAVRFLEGGLQLQQDADGPDHPRPYLTSVHLGLCLLKAGRFTEAEGALLEGYRGLQRAGSSQANLRLALDGLVELYDAWGQPEKAEEHRRLIPDRE